jgi:hypothetical protein
MKRRIFLALVAALLPGVGSAHDEDYGVLPYFARATQPYDESLSALAIAELRIDENNCLRHGDAVVLWHHDTVAEAAEDGRIRITDGYTGNAVHVGESIAMGGGGGSEISSWDGMNVAQPAPPDACTGVLWVGGPVSTAEETEVLTERMENRRVAPSPPGS